MECLNNYIGLLSCGSTPPLSGLYINSLPGITSKMFDKIANTDQVTLKNTWDDIQQRAGQRFSLDVRQAFNNKYKIQNITDSKALGDHIDASQVRPMSGEWRGFTIETDIINPLSIVQSNLQNIYIQTLSFYSPIIQAGSIIKIWDMNTGVEIDSLTFDAVVGWNLIQVNKKYSYRRMFVGIDSTNFDSVTFNLSNTRFYCFYSCNAFIYGAYSDTTKPQTISNVFKGNNTFGLSGIFGVRCSWDNVVCNNKDVFTLAWWYLLGVESMNQLLNSPRYNEFTTTDFKKYQELKTNFEYEYMGYTNAQNVFVPGALQQAIDGIQIDQSDCCIECNAPFMVQENTGSFFKNYNYYDNSKV